MNKFTCTLLLVIFHLSFADCQNTNTTDNDIQNSMYWYKALNQSNSSISKTNDLPYRALKNATAENPKLKSVLLAAQKIRKETASTQPFLSVNVV